MTVFDTATSSIEAQIDVAKGATATVGRGIAVSRDGRSAYLANGGLAGGLNTVSVIDTAVNEVVGTVDVGSRFFAIAI